MTTPTTPRGDELDEILNTLALHHYQNVSNERKAKDYKKAKQQLQALITQELEAQLDRLPLVCQNCKRKAPYIEAELRNFNHGMCAACGADALSIDFWAIQAERANLRKEK